MNLTICCLTGQGIPQTCIFWKYLFSVPNKIFRIFAFISNTKRHILPKTAFSIYDFLQYLFSGSKYPVVLYLQDMKVITGQFIVKALQPLFAEKRGGGEEDLKSEGQIFFRFFVIFHVFRILDVITNKCVAFAPAAFVQFTFKDPRMDVPKVSFQNATYDWILLLKTKFCSQ